MPQTGSRLGAMVVVLAGMLSACSGDPHTPPPLTPTSAASSPTAAGPVEPVLPEAARQPTAAGAKAFAEFYWEVGTYAQATGDTSGLRQLAAITCSPCEAGVEAIDDLDDKGAAIHGGAYTATAQKATRVASRFVAFDVRLDLGISAQRIDFPGTQRDTWTPERTLRFRMILNFLKGAWAVAHMEEA